MTDIAGLLENDTGKTFMCDVKATVKKPKSKLQTGGEWTQECVLSDLSGDIQAEVLLQGLSLERGNHIRIISGQIQNGASGVKLFVIGYVPETITEPEPYQPKEQHYSQEEIEQNGKPDWDKIAKGKTRCNIICAMIASGKYDELVENIEIPDNFKPKINQLINYIFEGK
ncbi:MAG: hypothetical protein WC356_02155 [Candidatus Micrarchaeia archaeon]|jgi:hypothetical protein